MPTREILAPILAAVILCGPAARTARADDLDAATRANLQSIITQQLDALGRDDATAAESFAAPGIKLRWPDPKDFAAMVRQSYAPLINPRSTHFDETDANGVGPLQKMTIIDHDGSAWTAVYSFEQVDGQWRINGCILVRDQGTNV